MPLQCKTCGSIPLRSRERKDSFVHTARTENKVKQTTKRARKVAEQAVNHPTLLVRIHHGKIEDSEFGFVNQATPFSYRIFQPFLGVFSGRYLGMF